jgi:hypothetical protein
MPSSSRDQENSRSFINRSTTADKIVKQDGGKTDIWRAAEMGSTSVVEALLKRGAGPNTLSSRKKTALHYAVVGGSLECVQMLLKNGADKTLQDDADKTALDYCKMFNDETKYGAFFFIFLFFPALFFFLLLQSILQFILQYIQQFILRFIYMLLLLLLCCCCCAFDFHVTDVAFFAFSLFPTFFLY